jgi:hypothetical protein
MEDIANLVDHLVDLRSRTSPLSSPGSPTSNSLSSTFNQFPQIFVDLRRYHREAYRDAEVSRSQSQLERDLALRARTDRLNRDWYKHHVEAVIESYERADLDFDPTDLISEEEMKDTLNPNELEAFPNKSKAEVMALRFRQESVQRLRKRTQVTTLERTKKTQQDRLRLQLDKEESMDKTILTWCNVRCQLLYLICRSQINMHFYSCTNFIDGRRFSQEKWN